eukprot:3125716-Rhodomonas_salina.1
MTALVGDGGMSKAMEVTGVGREEDQSSKAMILGRGSCGRRRSLDSPRPSLPQAHFGRERGRKRQDGA